ncbi:hypothetical protein [Lactiplantibacillus plantarum]|uniref:hypothetical protein n=1 Tax=Lactiplantibacillus plantarum TaxID=1590 RepID=UPI00217E7C4E|nr:hypothetical protein [Lactiplantibacillus plantarum]UWF40067.1 hypothetical protein NYR28_04755 [Lactiplantibacillus plantarum]WRM29214.1 hypothetical protein UHT29_05420 [Lactiplantibacillus plantarum]
MSSIKFGGIMKSNFSFLPFFKVLWYRLFWIVLFAVLGGISGYFAERQMFTPQYSVSSTVSVYHVKSKAGSNLDQLNTDVNRLGTVQSEIGDPGIYANASRLVKENKGTSIPTKYFIEHVSVSAKASSTILSVGATANTAQKAADMSNYVIQAYKNKYLKSDGRLRIEQLSKAKAMYATKSEPDYMKFIKNGALIGAILAYLVCLVLYFRKRNSKSK